MPACDCFKECSAVGLGILKLVYTNVHEEKLELKTSFFRSFWYQPCKIFSKSVIIFDYLQLF